MTHHIVLFSFGKIADAHEKETFLTEAKRAFEQLPQLIDCLQSLKVSININSKEEYDLMLHGVLLRKEDIETYANHPEHVARVAKYIKPWVTKRACVDVEE